MSIQDIIANFTEGLKTGMARVEDKVDSIGRRVEYKMERVKRRVLAYMLQLLFITLGLILITTGAILFFYRFFSLDVILLVTGAVFLYVALLVSWKH